MSDFDKVSLLQRRDLELEAQLENITNKAIKPQYTNHSPPPLITKKMKAPIFTNTPKAIGEMESRDMAFEIELENITNREVGALPDTKPSVINSAVTKEMIEDYNIEQTNPVKIGDQYFRYTPSSLAIDFELPILHVFARDFSEEQINEMKRNAEVQYNRDITEIMKRLKQNRDSKERIIETYNNENSELQHC